MDAAATEGKTVNIAVGSLRLFARPLLVAVAAGGKSEANPVATM